MKKIADTQNEVNSQERYAVTTIPQEHVKIDNKEVVLKDDTRLVLCMGINESRSPAVFNFSLKFRNGGAYSIQRGQYGPGRGISFSSYLVQYADIDPKALLNHYIRSTQDFEGYVCQCVLDHVLDQLKITAEIQQGGELIIVIIRLVHEGRMPDYEYVFRFYENEYEHFLEVLD